MIRRRRARAGWLRRPLLFGILLATFLVLAAGIGAASLGEADPVVEYAGTWQYRWGDSPRGPSGELLWAAAAPGDDAGWEAYGGAGSPPGREGRRSLWLRTRLEGGAARDPTLFLAGVDQVFEAYLDGALIYRFGDLEGPDAGRFRGYQAHYLPIGAGFQGKTLALRIWSEHVNAGLFGSQRLGSRAALQLAAFRRDLPTLGMGLILASIGAFMLALFATRREDRGYLTYGGFALSTGMYFISVSPSRELLAQAPLGWVYAELGFLYLMPVCFAAYFEHVFGRGRGSVVRWIARAHLAYVIGAAALVATGAVPVMKTLLPFQILLLVDFVFLVGRAARAAIRGSVDARIFTAGFAVAAISGAHDVLGAMGVLPRSQITVSHYGMFVFTMSMGLILGRRFVEVHERMARYSTVLQLSLASARVLEPGQHAQVALGELLRLLSARRALLFMIEPVTSSGGPGPAPEVLELRAAREVTPGGPPEGSPAPEEQIAYRRELVEQVRARRKPLIGRASGDGRSSVLCAPLVLREELLGAVYLERDPARRPFQEEDLEILLGLGSQISIAIVTTRAVRLELKSALQKARIARQEALLEAAARMAQGDLETPIAVASGELSDLARALDAMRRDVRAKIHMLEARNEEVQHLNEELRRKIEDQTGRLLSALLDEGGGEGEGPPRYAPGAMIGDRYTVISVLGEGAMGVVYEVERAPDGKRMAVKVMSSRGDRVAVARFVREAQILARLDHPNLISIVDVDVAEGGVLFLAMELAPGATLFKFQHRFRDVIWVLSVLRQIADALAAVHARGVVHRDLKLGNVLVSEGPGGEPRVKLADFGISIMVGVEGPASIGQDAPTRPLGRGRQDEVTRTGMLVGTPGYMAPELGRGSRVAAAPSDVFSLGVMAYEMLTHERPFVVPPVFLAAQGLPLEVPDGLRRVEDLDPVLAELFERCMAASPEARPTAAEVATTLAEFGIAGPTEAER